MSLYSLKNAGGGVQSWASTLTLFPGNGDVSLLFNLYDSAGDVTLLGSNTIPTLKDGPEKVVRYGGLTLGDGATATSLTASQRCKGLVILCDSLTVKANATLHMTARGARVDRNDDPFFPFIDFVIPFQIVLGSSKIPYTHALTEIKDGGFAPWDQGTWQHHVAALYGFNLSVCLAGSVALLSANGCGVGATQSNASGSGAQSGVVGAVGTNGGMGGGGSGGTYVYSNANATSGRGGSGCPYSGGSGSGSSVNGTQWGYGVQHGTGKNSSRFSGPGSGGGFLYYNATSFTEEPGACGGGGGAGNPPGAAGAGFGGVGGVGTGGKLTIISRGAVTVQSGGKIEANGIKGGDYGGGGSGGGHISLISASAVSNSGTIQAAGGAGGDAIGICAGGAGGAGSVVTKTFTQMGW